MARSILRGARGLAALGSLLAVAVAGCGAISPEQDAAARRTALETTSGIQGRITMGPTCPAVVPGRVCPDAPLAVGVSVRDAGDVQVARVSSGSDGRFQQPLAPGRYALLPETPAGDSPPAPEVERIEIEVRAGEWLQVDIRYDTGIR